MARKTLKDFNNDPQAYANYLESAQCMQDDGIDVYAEGRNVYTPTEGDWTKGHGHYYDATGLNRESWERKPEDDESYDRPWYNKWLELSDDIILSEAEFNLSTNQKILIKK